MWIEIENVMLDLTKFISIMPINRDTLRCRTSGGDVGIIDYYFDTQAKRDNAFKKIKDLLLKQQPVSVNTYGGPNGPI